MDEKQKLAAINSCRNKISANNESIRILSRENQRLFNSLMLMMNEIPKETKERYDRELASDNWKKYSKTHRMLKNQ